MGHILRMLAKTEIGSAPSAWGHRLTIEDCENIHLHYRNRRLEFSDKEFLAFAETVSEAASKLKDKRDNKNNCGMVLAKAAVDKVADHQCKKLTVEANQDAYHLHIRDLRVDCYHKNEFQTLASIMTKAFIQFIDYRLTKEDRIIMPLPLALIDSFDAGHRLVAPGEKGRLPEAAKHGFMAIPADEHNSKVDEVLEAIKQNKIIRPIVISYQNGIFQRTDGFCRYWAHRLAQKEEINCIIHKSKQLGLQGKKNAVITKKEYEDILQGKTF